MAGADESWINILNDWEKDIKEQSRLKELGNNQVVKGIVDKLKELIDNINKTLQDDKECDRKALFDQRDCWHWLINLFNGADETLNDINKQIEDNLKIIN